MLKKVQVGGIGMIIAVALQILRLFFPDIPFPEGLSEALVLIVTWISMFFVKETRATVDKLTLR